MLTNIWLMVLGAEAPAPRCAPALFWPPCLYAVRKGGLEPGRRKILHLRGSKIEDGECSNFGPWRLKMEVHLPSGAEHLKIEDRKLLHLAFEDGRWGFSSTFNLWRWKIKRYFIFTFRRWTMESSSIFTSQSLKNGGRLRLDIQSDLRILKVEASSIFNIFWPFRSKTDQLSLSLTFDS